MSPRGVPTPRPARVPDRGPLRLRVPALLAARGMTAYELHMRAGRRISLTTAQALAKPDNGRTRVSLTVLGALCDVLDVTPGDLFTRDHRDHR